MNYRSLSVAAFVAWVIDSCYGFVVYGELLNGEFSKYPGVFRSFDEVSGLLPLMFGSSLLGMFAVAYIFAKGREGGRGLVEGFRFGVIFAAFGLFGISIPNYVIYNYGRRLAAEAAVAGAIEMVLMGVVLGLMYRPTTRRMSQAAV